jgi:hypothetical protein
MATLNRMGDFQPPLFAADELPPQREKRRRMPTTLPPHLRKWLTKLARIGARISWTIELLYDPSKGGQGELCERARAGDHTLVLDTVRDGEYQMSQLGEDIEVFMRPPDRLPSEPGKPARVEAMARRQMAKMHIFD